MMNFLKDWIIQYQNKFSVGGVETTIERVTGTVSQAGDTISAAYLNEIQKNCIYQVNATRVIEGVLEIYDITIDGSEEFTPFNQTFLIDFSATNTQVDSLLRFNGNTYSLRFSDSILNGDIAPKIGFLPKRALVKLDVTNSKAVIVDFNPNNFISPAFTGTPTAPTGTIGVSSNQIATQEFATNQDLGVRQTPQDVTSSRSLNTTYTNITGKPILLSVWGGWNALNFNITITCNGMTVARNGNTGTTANYIAGTSFIIPPGATYSVLIEGGVLKNWVELR